MTNLLSNSVKYSAHRDRPMIKIWSYKEGSELIYAVRDNGAGFDMAYAGKLFGVSGIPTTYIIDRNGNVSDAIVGYDEGDKRVEAALKKLGVIVP